MNQPLFSVVIPTLNRSDLVAFAIQSVLRQTFHDFELIVSDHCSEDETAEIVKRFTDPRIRYVRPDRRLPSFDEHWEFARSHAKGYFILMLGDDDALVASALECFAKAAEDYDADFLFSVEARCFDYSYPGPEAGTLRVFPFTGNAWKVDPYDDLIKPFFKLQPKYRLHMSTSVYAKPLVDRIVTRTGRLCHPPIIDFTLWALAAVCAKSTVLIDVPLGVVGHTIKSHTTNLTLYNPGREKREEFSAQHSLELRFVPLNLKGWVNRNIVAEALLLAKELMPEAFKEVTLDEVAYVQSVIADLKYMESQGVDVQEHMLQVTNYMASRPDIADAVLLSPQDSMVKTADAVLLSPQDSMVKTAVRRIRRLIGDLGARKLRNWIRTRVTDRRHKSNGNHLGFEVSWSSAGLYNILDCAKFLEVHAQRFLKTQF